MNLAQEKDNEIEECIIEKLSSTTFKILNCLEKNEIGDAELFVERFKDKYVFDPYEGKSGAFYLWNGSVWALDTHKERYKDFDEVADEYLKASEANELDKTTKEALKKRAKDLRAHRRRQNVLETVSSSLSFRETWDISPYLLPCKNGVVDLRTGTFTETKREQIPKKKNLCL